MTTLFISDLHLDPSRPAVVRAFFQFLRSQAINADALYILGDFFEVWIGDDDDSELARSVISALKHVTTSGTPVFLMHGNRDFLIGSKFLDQSGCQMLQDPTTVSLYGQPILLMHGDTLCTDDLAYMEFRAECRRKEWQSALLSQPLTERRLLATQMRAESKNANSNKAAAIMDVNQQEVQRVMQSNQTRMMIHGHTHRPAVHQVDLPSTDVNERSAVRIVLGDWHSTGWVLRYQADNSYTLEEFTID
ncbi:MAG: UDP-2,3-diacylglucosamine diphosphatase [Oceanicoccus sp.]